MRRALVGIEPWKAAGPGWANAGITYRYTDESGRHEDPVTVYTQDFNETEHLLFPILLAIYGSLERARPTEVDATSEIEAATDERIEAIKKSAKSALAGDPSWQTSKDSMPINPRTVMSLIARNDYEKERAEKAEVLLACIMKATGYSMCFDGEAWAEAEAILKNTK